MNNTATDRLRLSTRATRAATLALGIACAALAAGCGDSGTSTASSPSSPATGGATPAAKSEAPFVMPVTAANTGPADTAWTALEAGFHSPPTPPEAWRTNEPSRAEIEEFQKSRGVAAEKLADLARDFYGKYPDDARSAEARAHELELLDAATKLGNTNATPRLAALEKARLEDPKSTEDDRFGIRMAQAQRTAQALVADSEDAARASFEESARKLMVEFPKRPEPYQMLLSLTAGAPAEKARATAQSLTSTNVPQEVREAAEAILRKLDIAGKPLDLKFAALDGREIDMTKLRGKVVLVDFWATWCGPCMRELPNVKATYAKLNPKGFEILGISFDEEKEALTKVLEREKMTWPQFFDGKGWANEFGRRFGIDSIPAMWLVDKKGIVRDLEAREDLEEKVTKLLAEEDPK
jgi:thiol-disulfide isomerase/thioredoxin